MPYPEELYSEARDWANKAIELLRELMPLVEPLGRDLRWSPSQRDTLAHLFSATSRSTESALLLVAYTQLWDAETLVRSALEGTIKLCFLLQHEEKFTARWIEYSGALFDIGRLKDQAKLRDLIAAVTNTDSVSWRPVKDLLLSDDEVAELRGRYDPSVRRQIEQRWGFTELVRVLAGSDDELFRNFGGLGYSYSIASHIAHADTIGTSLALDREKRPREHRDAMHRAHAARLISNLLGLFHLRLAIGRRHVRADMASVSEAAAKIEQLVLSFGPVQEQWLAMEYGSNAPEQPANPP